MRKSLIVLVLLIIVILIGASLSKEASNKLTINIIRQVYNNTSLSFSRSTFLVRKSFHLIIYFMLGFVIFYVLIKNNKLTNIKAFLNSLFIVLLIGSLDEIIQGYQKGRIFSYMDIFIDFTGGFIGIFLSYILFKKSNKNLI